MDQTQSPVDYPTIKVGTSTYTVKFSNAALYRLDKAGTDLNAFGENLRLAADAMRRGEPPTTLKMSMVYDLLSACIVGVRLNPEDLADAVPISEAARTVIEAMGKVRPSSQPAAVSATEMPVTPDKPDLQ